jgi:hypothetical protein
MERETKDSGRKTKLPKKLKEDLMFLRTPDNPTHAHPPTPNASSEHPDNPTLQPEKST